MKTAGNILSNLDASFYSKAMTNDATLGICSDLFTMRVAKLKKL